MLEEFIASIIILEHVVTAELQCVRTLELLTRISFLTSKAAANVHPSRHIRGDRFGVVVDATVRTAKPGILVKLSDRHPARTGIAAFSGANLFRMTDKNSAAESQIIHSVTTRYRWTN
jgi:hypothetical protein